MDQSLALALKSENGIVVKKAPEQKVGPSRVLPDSSSPKTETSVLFVIDN